MSRNSNERSSDEPSSDKLCLEGLTFLNFRALEQAENLTRLLTDRGSEVIHLPLFLREVSPETELLSAELLRIRQTSPKRAWVVFTSQNSVSVIREGENRFFELLSEAVSAGEISVGAVGSVTAKVLAQVGITTVSCPALDSRPGVSGQSDGRALAELMLELSGEAIQEVLLVRGDPATADLPERLARAGWTIHDRAVYRMRANELDSEQLREIVGRREVTVPIFFSGESVAAFRKAVAEIVADPRQICGEFLIAAVIGPRTAEIAASAGFSQLLVAKRQSSEAVVEAIIQHFCQAGANP